MRPSHLLPVAAALAALAGCGSASSPATTTVTVEKTSPAASTPSATPTSPRSASPATKSAPLRHLSTFQSPSHNIGCQIIGGEARCDIREHSWTAPPKPASCDLDWGNGVQLHATGKATITCAGDTVLNPSAPVLRYGESTRVGSLVCASRPDGVRCRNADGSHGFSLARGSYSAY